MKILITGVAGLIGSKFADWLASNYKNYEIYGIDDLSGGYIENINEKVKFYQLNLQNFDEISDFLKMKQKKVNLT